MIDHRRWPAEKNHRPGIGRGEMLVQDVVSDPPTTLRPIHGWLFENMVAVEISMFSHIPIPLLTENNICFSLVGENQEQLSILMLRENPANDRDHRCDPGTACHEPHVLCHAIDPMASLVRSAHQHGVPDLLLMEILRNRACFIALHCQ